MIELGASIAAATEVLSLVPKVSALIKGSADLFSILKSMKFDEDDMPPIIVKLISNEKRRLDELIDKYYKIDDDKTADEVEKKNARLRIAAQICQLLTGIDPLKDGIAGYAEVKQMYCDSIPSALNS